MSALCAECGHLEERHHFYSRCDATLNQPASCLCLLTPADIQAARATHLLADS